MNDKYKMFKNFMFNELGITREDIRDWTKEAVKEVAEEHIKHHVDIESIARAITRNIGTYEIENATKKCLADMIQSQLTIKIDKKQ